MLLQSQITKKLASAGLDYLRIGLNRFHSVYEKSNNNYQASIGNICIATELILKAIISHRSFILLFSNLPTEVKVKFTDKRSGSFINLPPYHRFNIENFHTKTIKFDRAIGIFYHLHPSAKQEFRPFLKTAADIRNVSVHGAIPEFQIYNSEWIAYSAISLIKFLKDEDYHFLSSFQITKQDKTFHELFDRERNKRVQKLVKEAQQKAKNVSPAFIDLPADVFDLHVIKCPICKSEAYLEGYTELESDNAGNGDIEIWLNFYAENFECEGCGLKLNGVEELELLDIDPIHEKTGSLDAWLDEAQQEYKADQQ